MPSLEFRIATRDDSRDELINAECAARIFKHLKVTPRIYLPMNHSQSTRLILIASQVLRDEKPKTLKLETAVFA